jgi:hypothetical protein
METFHEQGTGVPGCTPIFIRNKEKTDRLASAPDQIYKQQQEDRTNQGDQHSWKGDCTDTNWRDMEQGGEEVTGDESANDGNDNVDQQVRAVMHDLSGNPADNCGYDEIDNDIYHGSLLFD